jgi:hypothetical protein
VNNPQIYLGEANILPKPNAGGVALVLRGTPIFAPNDIIYKKGKSDL